MLSDHARAHSLATRARVGVFVGYDKYSKGYRVHFPDTGDLAISHNVGFHEDKGYAFTSLTPPYHPTSSSSRDPPAGPSLHLPGTRPRLVVIGPRPPPPPADSPKIVEIETLSSAPAPEPPAAAQPPAAARGPVEAVDPTASSPVPAAAPQAAPATANRRRARDPPSVQYQTRQHVQRQQQGRQQREAAAGTVISLSNSFATSFRAQRSADGVKLEPSTLQEAMRRTDWPLWLECNSSAEL
ncbi:unnamed protein product [Tilletia controversa]|nr:hypothetical protein CF328_g6751 [Tilletia controversa]CAD6981535.1 unnamed protein product [Tilletia controversa]CAD6982876.1 unnamed protein product [Tilletia controversa]